MIDPIGDSGARTLLEEGLRELELVVSPAQIHALLSISELLVSWAERINLTGHRGPRAVVQRLILDAAALHQQIGTVESLADLGSGAGFPGLPLAILRPGCRVTLVEARGRRHHFQRAAVRAGDLSNAELLLGRAESLTALPHDAVLAQAMAVPDRALAWMLPWARPAGGALYLPGGAEERPPPAHPKVMWRACHRYRVPCGGPERTLWEGRRLS